MEGANFLFPINFVLSIHGESICRELEQLYEEKSKFISHSFRAGRQATISGDSKEQKNEGLMKVSRFFINTFQLLGVIYDVV